MARGVQAQQRGAQQRPARQVERAHHLLGGEPQGLRLARLLRQAREVDAGKRQRGRRGDPLHRLSVSIVRQSEGRPQRLVPRHHLLQAGGEGRAVERAGEQDRGRQVVGRVPRLELVEEPEPLLREGERQGRAGGPPRDRSPDAGSFPLARREGHRELRGGRRLEDAPQRQLRTQLLVQARHQMGGQERVAPEIEEAVVAAHRLHAEQLAQDLHQTPLGRVARRRVGDVETRPDMPPDGRRGHRGRRRDRCLNRTRDRGRHGRLGTRLDPVAPALERVGRQRHAAPRLIRPERGPVGAQAGEPEPPHGLEQEGEVVRALEGVAQGRQRHRIGPAGCRGLLQRPGGERLARPDLDQHPPGLAPQLAHRIREPHRAAQVLRPVGGVRRLFGGDPAAGDIGEIGDLRRMQLDPLEERQEALHRRLHQGRMEGVRRLQPAADVARSGQPLLGRGHRFLRPRKHSQLRPGDRGERKTLGEPPLGHSDRLLAQRHREHRSAGQLVDQPGAAGHQAQRIVERQHAGEAGRHVLADAEAHHRLRPDPPVEQAGGQRVLDEEDRRLRQRGAAQALPGLLAARSPGAAAEQAAQVDPLVGDLLSPLLLGEEDLPQVHPQERLEPRRTVVDPRAEPGIVAVQPARHAGVFVPQAGEEEGDLGIDGGGAGEQPARIAPLQDLDGVLEIADREHAAMGERAAPDLKGVRDVRQPGGRLRRQLAEMAEKAVGGRLERRLRARRQHQQKPGRRRSGRRRCGRLLQDDVRVDAADREGADAGAPRPALRPPGPAFGVDVEGAPREIDARVGRREVEAGRQDPVLHRQDGLDQARDPRRGVEMADVGLDRAQGAEPPLLGGRREHLGEGGDLHHITQRGAGAVRLDVGDRLGGHPRDGLGCRDRLELALRGRRGEAHLEPAVVVGREAADHGVDRVPVGHGVGQPLEDHHAGAAPLHRAARRGVEGAAVAVRRHHAVQRQIAQPVRDDHGHAAGQHHVALELEQALAGHARRHQGGRAGALHGDARPPQIELVRRQRGQEVVVVQDADLERSGVLDQVGMGEEVADQVAAHPHAGEEADRAGPGPGVIARVLQSLPAALEKEPVLRIHQLRLARAEVEEVGVEMLHVAQGGARPDVARVVEQRRGDPRGRQLLAGVEADRFDSAAQVAPELPQVVGAGETSGHADDGDPFEGAALRILLTHLVLPSPDLTVRASFAGSRAAAAAPRPPVAGGRGSLPPPRPGPGPGPGAPRQ